MTEPNLKKHSLYLYRGDYERVQTLHPEVGAAIIIRNLVRDYIRDRDSVLPPLDLSRIKLQIQL